MPQKKYLIITLALLLFFIKDAHAIFYKRFNTSNAILSNRIYHVTKDSRGFLWFCTPNGISKFDGKNFRNYTVLEGLGDNDVFNLLEDKIGRLWVCAYNGTNCFIYHDSVFNAGNSNLLKKLPGLSYITTIYDAGDSVLYIGYKHGQILKINGNNVVWVKKTLEEYGSTWQISFYNKSIIAFCGYNKLKIVNDTFINLGSTGPLQGFAFKDKLIGCDLFGIKILNNDSVEWRYNNNNTNLFNTIYLYHDNKDNVFACTHNGLFIINKLTGKETKLFNDFSVSCIVQDIDENYWVTTLNNGVYVINRELNEINYIDNISGGNSIFTEFGQLFILKNDNVYYLPNQLPILQKIPISFNNLLNPLYIDDDLFIYGDRSKLKTLFYDRKTKTTNEVNILLKLVNPINKNKFLCNGYKYLLEVTIENKKPKINKIIFDQWILQRVYDKKNKYYFISNKNLYQYNCNVSSLVKIDSFKDYETPINIFIANNLLIIFTNSNMIVYNTEYNFRKTLYKNRNMLMYNIYTSDSNNKYILHTNLGYYSAIIDFEHFEKTILTKVEYPLRQSEITYLYPYRDKYICNVEDNLYALNSNMFDKKIGSPAIFLNRIWINNIATNDTNIILNNSSKCIVKIQMGSLFFNNANQVYQYRVLENDNIGEWNTGTSLEFDLLLHSGMYRIEIRAVTENNVYSPLKVITLKINPPFYFTLYFYIILTVFALLFTVYIVYIIIKRRKKHFQQELNYMQMENKAINSLINPHFIFNALNNIQGLINLGSKEKANEYVSFVGKLIRQNLENLQFTFIPIEKELELIKNYIMVQNLRFGDKIKYTLHNNISDIVNIQIPPLIIHTFIENAVVHGYKKEIDDFEIKLELNIHKDNYISIKITDNGTGYNKDNISQSPLKNKMSLGLAFTKKRLKRLSDFYNVDYSLEIHNLYPTLDHKGTEAVIILYSGFKEQLKEQ